MNHKVVRVLEWYEKDPGDCLIGEEVLLGVTLEELQEIFEIEKSNPMYDCYKVEIKEANKLQNFIKTKIDTEQYNYFVAVR